MTQLLLTQRLECSFTGWSSIIPQKTIGHNQEGTTLEPLGKACMNIEPSGNLKQGEPDSLRAPSSAASWLCPWDPHTNPAMYMFI